jgi:hypothetical protein
MSTVVRFAVSHTVPNCHASVSRRERFGSGCGAAGAAMTGPRTRRAFAPTCRQRLTANRPFLRCRRITFAHAAFLFNTRIAVAAWQGICPKRARIAGARSPSRWYLYHRGVRGGTTRGDQPREPVDREFGRAITSERAEPLCPERRRRELRLLPRTPACGEPGAGGDGPICARDDRLWGGAAQQPFADPTLLMIGLRQTPAIAGRGAARERRGPL